MTYPQSNLRTAVYDPITNQIDPPQLNTSPVAQSVQTGGILLGNQLYIVGRSSGIVIGVCGGATSSVGNNGALTGLTALPVQYPKIFMYFPAGALYSGSVAGFYYAEMSSTTAATVYNNILDISNPAWPSVKTPIVATGPGAFTQVSGSPIPVFQYTLNANALGSNGRILCEHLVAVTNSANNKTCDLRIAGNVVDGSTATTQNSARFLHVMYNSGDAGRQVGNNFGTIGPSNSSLTRRTVDTTVDQLITLTILNANAAEYIVSEGRHLQVTYGA